jgi:hypothetical protein
LVGKLAVSSEDRTSGLQRAILHRAEINRFGEARSLLRQEGNDLSPIDFNEVSTGPPNDVFVSESECCQFDPIRAVARGTGLLPRIKLPPDRKIERLGGKPGQSD